LCGNSILNEGAVPVDDRKVGRRAITHKTAKPESDSVPVDGLGASACVSCHSAAGSDAEHRPSPNARDFVYKVVE
jgi:hypothetical protein